MIKKQGSPEKIVKILKEGKPSKEEVKEVKTKSKKDIIK